MASRTVTVRVSVYVNPSSLPGKVEAINAKLESYGWKLQGFAVGETSGWLPRTIPVRWTAFYRDGADLKADIIKAKGGAVNTYFEAWNDWQVQVSEEIVKQTAKDFSDTVQNAVPKFAFGFGMVLAIVAVVGAGILYAKYGRK